MYMSGESSSSFSKISGLASLRKLMFKLTAPSPVAIFLPAISFTDKVRVEVSRAWG